MPSLAKLYAINQKINQNSFVKPSGKSSPTRIIPYPFHYLQHISNLSFFHLGRGGRFNIFLKTFPATLMATLSFSQNYYRQIKDFMTCCCIFPDDWITLTVSRSKIVLALNQDRLLKFSSFTLLKYFLSTV